MTGTRKERSTTPRVTDPVGIFGTNFYLLVVVGPTDFCYTSFGREVGT